MSDGTTDIGLPVDETYAPPARVREGAHVGSREEYEELRRRSIEDREAFWAEQARANLEWMSDFQTVVEEDFTTGHIAWFKEGTLNVSVNCLDRHLATRGDQIALLLEGDEPGDNRSLTYREVADKVGRLANALRARGVGKGDRIAIYMGMVPELVVAMLACARIGAVHSVIFGGFSPRSIVDRVEDSTCKAIITQDEGMRGGRTVALKANVDEALTMGGESIEFVIVYKRTDAGVSMTEGRDIWWDDALAGQSTEAEPEEMGAEDPLFILYTSGSTGKPKGVLHTQAGLPALHDALASLHVRLPGRGHLLLRGGCRLDHGAQLHRVRATGERGHIGAVSSRCRPTPTRDATGTWSTGWGSTASTRLRRRSGRSPRRATTT